MTHYSAPLHLRSAIDTFDAAADGISEDAEHQAALELRDAAQAIMATMVDVAMEPVTHTAVITRPSDEPLTGSEAVLLANIVKAAWNRSRIARALDNGYVVTGTARGVGDDRGAHAGPNDDIRECYLHVTMDSGWEQFWPMSETVEALQQKLLVIK